jgi:hypothetical protein
VESGTLIMNFLVGKLIAKEEIKVFWKQAKKVPCSKLMCPSDYDEGWLQLLPI